MPAEGGGGGRLNQHVVVPSGKCNKAAWPTFGHKLQARKAAVLQSATLKSATGRRAGLPLVPQWERGGWVGCRVPTAGCN